MYCGSNDYWVVCFMGVNWILLVSFGACECLVLLYGFRVCLSGLC